MRAKRSPDVQLLPVGSGLCGLGSGFILVSTETTSIYTEDTKQQKLLYGEFIKVLGCLILFPIKPNLMGFNGINSFL